MIFTIPIVQTMTTKFVDYGRSPTPLGVQGLCSVVVWYSPVVSCEDICGYEVRLYNPRLSHLNVTNRIGANATFYIVDEEKPDSSDETNVQVDSLPC